MLFRPANFTSARSPVLYRDSNIVERENLPSETIPLERLSESVSYMFKPQVPTHKNVRHAQRHSYIKTMSVAVQTETASRFDRPDSRSIGVNTGPQELAGPQKEECAPILTQTLAEKAKKLQERQATWEAFLADVRERSTREPHVENDRGKVKRMVALTNARQVGTALSPRLNESGISFRPLMTPSPTHRRE